MDKAGKENNDAKMTDSASQKIVTASLESSYLNVFISSYIAYERSLSWLKKKLVTYSFFVSPNASQFIKSSEKSIQSICLIFFINQQRWIRPKKIKFNVRKENPVSWVCLLFVGDTGMRAVWLRSRRCVQGLGILGNYRLSGVSNVS